MFLNRCSYKNNCSIELVYNSNILVIMIYSFKYLLKGLALNFLFLRLAVSVYIVYPLRISSTDLLFINKILIFQNES